MLVLRPVDIINQQYLVSGGWELNNILCMFLSRLLLLFSACSLFLPAPSFAMSVSSAGSVKAWVSKTAPLTHEAVIYTIRVYTPMPVSRLEITPPTVSHAMLQELEGPVRGKQVLDGVPMTTNDFHYLLIPEQQGTLEIGSAHVVAHSAYRMGWMTDKNVRPLTMVSNPLVLAIKPIGRAGDKAGLPASSVEVSAYWSEKGMTGERGQPLTLTVETRARGAIGQQLPSVWPHLKNAGYAIQPESNETGWEVTEGDSIIHGRRVETFTINPGNRDVVSLPPIDVSWWNVVSRQPEHTVASVQDVVFDSPVVDSEASPLTQRIQSRHALHYFLLPISVGFLFALAFGKWICSRQPVSGK